MALPYVDVASPILRAYFEGKNSRLEREAFENRKMVEQQKLEQENQQFAERQKMEQDRQKQLMEMHKDVTENNKQHLAVSQAQLELQKLQADQAARNHMLQLRKSDTFNPPSTPDQGPPETSEERPQRTIQPYTFQGARGPITIQPGEWPEPDASKMAVMQENQRLSEERALKLAGINSETANNRTQAMIDIADRRAQAMVEAAGLRAEGSGKKGGPQFFKGISKSFEDVKKSKEADMLNKSEKATQIAGEYYNQLYKKFDETGQRNKALIGKPVGHKDVNLVLNYLQSTLPSTRVTNFEFQKTAASDSNINQLQQRVKEWVSSGKLTDEVRRNIMDELKTAHEENVKAFNRKKDSAVSGAETLAGLSGMDPEDIAKLAESHFGTYNNTVTQPKQPEKGFEEYKGYKVLSAPIGRK